MIGVLIFFLLFFKENKFWNIEELCTPCKMLPWISTEYPQNKISLNARKNSTLYIGAFEI